MLAKMWRNWNTGTLLVKVWNSVATMEKSVEIHEGIKNKIIWCFPILNPPPSSLLVPSLWVIKLKNKKIKKSAIKKKYDASLSLLHICSKEYKVECWTDICIPMSIAALFTVAKRWLCKCPLMDEWVSKMWYLQTT